MRSTDCVRIADSVLKEHGDIGCVVRGLNPARPEDEEALACGSAKVLLGLDDMHKRHIRIWDVANGIKHEVDPISGRRFDDRFKP